MIVGAWMCVGFGSDPRGEDGRGFSHHCSGHQSGEGKILMDDSFSLMLGNEWIT